MSPNDIYISNRKLRIMSRNEKIKQRFMVLVSKKIKGKKKYTNEAVFAMLSEEFEPLSIRTIENIVFDRVKYTTTTKKS